eukprot:6639550-Prymnesium_polylepis.1
MPSPGREAPSQSRSSTFGSWLPDRQRTRAAGSPRLARLRHPPPPSRGSGPCLAALAQAGCTS